MTFLDKLNLTFFKEETTDLSVFNLSPELENLLLSLKPVIKYDEEITLDTFILEENLNLIIDEFIVEKQKNLDINDILLKINTSVKSNNNFSLFNTFKDFNRKYFLFFKSSDHIRLSKYV